MKRFWLKGIFFGAVVALPFALVILQSQNREPSHARRLPIQRKLSGAQRRAESAEWFLSQRTYPLGYIPKDAEIRAVEDLRTRMIPDLQARSSLQKSAAASLSWESHGPGNIGGRLRGLLIHPNNPNVLYAGSVSGGVWKSVDGGANWSPTMNDLITLNISALAMKPGDPNTIYAGTGEAYFSADALPGRGLLKTTDGGNTWRRIHVAQGLNSPFLTSIAVSPAHPNVVYASGRKASPSVPLPAESVPDPGVSAIFKSVDSGETWQDITSGKGIEHNPQIESDEYAAQVIADPTDANIVYASFGLYAPGGIWKSSNGGQTWSRLTNGLPDPSLPNLGYERIELALAPSNTNVLYASFSYSRKAGDTSTLPERAMLGLWKSTNAGQSWTQVATPMTTSILNQNYGDLTALGTQGTYANAVAVHPTDPNTVFVAGLDIYKSTNGGNTWSQVSLWEENAAQREGFPHVHADHHVLVFDPSTNPPTLYNGSDGGIARSRDLGASWSALNKYLGVTQFYFFAAHPDNPSIMMGGSQDNGTPMLFDGLLNNWSDVTGGDGGPAYFDYNNPSNVYASVYRVTMMRATVNFATRQFSNVKNIGYTDGSNGITQDDVKGAKFFAPYEMSPNNPNVLILGTNRILKTTNRGDSWTPLSNALSVPFVAVAIAEGNDNVFWVANSQAQIFKTEDGGATYANVTGANLPNRYVTDIELDPSNAGTVYLTYSGYGTPHVFKSANAGASWSDITNNLPDAPANALQVHPQNSNQLFLGTDIGVFMSEDAGQTWQPAGNNFPTVQVVAIQINLKTNRVYAATHGRGVYSAQLSGSGAAVLNVAASEIAIQAKPGQTGAANFAMANTGGAELTFNIATSGGQANSAVGSANGEKASLRGSNAPLETILPFQKRAKHFENASHAAATPAFALAQPSALRGNDVLVLDDGNTGPDGFIGEGPNSFLSFYWMNQFDLAQDFQLEAIQVYMRTEAQSSNTVEIAVLDGNFKDLARGSVDLGLAQNGDWYTITLNNPISFKSGERFYLEMGANYAIEYPAGADKNAQAPGKSFHYNWAAGQYEAIGALAEYANGAYLIRAAGTKGGGSTNQPPVAKAALSKSQANVNEPITFDASQSSDPDGQIVQYAWDFGDNNSSNQKVAAHAYAQAGNYLVKLVVTDDKGATGQVVGLVTIASGATNRLAAAPASGTIAPGGTQTINVTFDAQGLAEGEYQGQISITSNGGNRTLPVRIKVSSNTTMVAELAYDDGTPKRAYNWPQAGQGSAVRFTPPSASAKLRQAKIFFTDIAAGNQVNLRVLADANGKPGSAMHGPVAVTVAATGWNTIDLSAANISINGDFYVMIEYNGASKPFFGSEDTQPLAKRSWDFDGQNWVLFDSEDYLIRAVVEYTTTSVEERDDTNSAPTTFALSQNFPNPFSANESFGNAETTIKYQLPQSATVELAVYDLNGRRVATLASGVQNSGEHRVHWNARDQLGQRVASGIYFYRLEAATPQGMAAIRTKKLTLLK